MPTYAAQIGSTLTELRRTHGADLGNVGSDAPGTRQGQPGHQGHPPHRPLVLQPGQGLGPVQTLDVLDEGEDAAANPLVS